MAGDLNIHEQAIVLTTGATDAGAFAGSMAAVEQVSGGVTHQYGQRVIIAAVPPAASPSLLQRTPFATLAAEPAAISQAVMKGLDEEEALGLAAFGLRQSPEYTAAKSQRPYADAPWDTEGVLHPDAPEGADVAAPPALLAGAAPTSSRLTGKVAVGIIIVEGPTNDLKFSSAERTKVVAEVQNGLTWLGSQSSPAGVSWVYDIRVVTLTVKPGPASQTFEQKEARWRDPALAQLGHGPGLAGAQAYVENLRSSKGTNWAYCAFFTKYPIGHFAYASIGGPRLVMDYNNDGWGPDNIDRVFAHETGHIFNAPDEYKASGCNCGGQWGFFNMPNTNCETCAPNGGVPCIMKGNTWETCAYTPFHLGFPQGQRYSGVFQAGSGGHGLWVNADWNNFVAKWNEWNNQGLRLDDLEISQPGGQLRYSGVFRQGSGGYGLWALADWNSFVAKWNEWNGQGLRLVDLEITKLGNDTRYSGVYQAGSGGHGLWVNADWSSFVNKWNEWNGQGLRLVDFDITVTGIEGAASPIAGATAGAGAEIGSAGYGFLSVGASTGDNQNSGTGFGAVSLSGAASGGNQPGGAGFGAVSLSGSAAGNQQPGGAGFGAVSLSRATSGDDQSGGTGYGGVSLPKTSAADGDEDSGAGFGGLVL